MRSAPHFLIKEKAQIIPIVVIGVIALIAMSALIIDGGALLFNRRSAQAAADAGALAGARELCYSTGADPATVAETYAITENGASSATASVTGDLVNVEAIISSSSFFAGIFGEPTLQTGAEAEAGCFSPRGNYVMPIAWSCRPPIGSGPFDPDLGCKMQALDYTDELKPLMEGDTVNIDGVDYVMDNDDIIDADGVSPEIPPDQIYIVMDKLALNMETLCREDLLPSDPNYLNAIVCDVTGDGKNDIEGGGNRGWLDLTSGGGGASDMRTWIEDGVDFPLAPHTWLSGQPGAVVNVYESLKDYRQGQIVLIPVFNALCDEADPTTNATCMANAHAYPWPAEPVTGDVVPSHAKPQFHIITFDYFYISCVHSKQNDKCPGFDLAQALNPDPAHPGKSIIPDNIPSVEGYFIKDSMDMIPDPDQPCVINLGNCTVSLTK